jgi:hypothetical protein
MLLDSNERPKAVIGKAFVMNLGFYAYATYSNPRDLNDACLP